MNIREIGLCNYVHWTLRHSNKKYNLSYNQNNLSAIIAYQEKDKFKALL